MDQKTKEIVERLREHSEAHRAYHDAGAIDVNEPFRGIVMDQAASLIESLSERVGELERNLKEAHDWFSTNRPQWGPGTLPTWFVDSERALPKQGEGS